MKFKRLAIKNVASIKNATIDFDKDPIKSAQLFLINGPTGSGKSVIFDSICLALFKTAPRLENLSRREIEDSLSEEGTLKLSSPLSLVRRGESNASVVLDFEGNNGHDYQARWETEIYTRGEKKGTIKSDIQSVIDSTDNKEFRKSAEIKSLIESNDVIGLDFARFTRTTMLAQGSFTRFLSAEAKEKTDILQKIVGLDYFKTIGKKIFEIYTNKRNELETKKAVLNSIIFMDDEALAQAKQELNDTVQKHQNHKKEHEHLKRFVDYMSNMKRLEEQVVQHKTAWEDALRHATSDYYFDLVTLYGYLDRVKPLADIIIKLSEVGNIKQTLENELTSLGRRRMSVIKGLTALSNRIQSDEKQSTEIEQKVKSFDEFGEILDNLSGLKEKVKQYDSLAKKEQEIKARIQTITKEISDIETPIKILTDEIKAIEVDYNKASESEKKLKELFDENEFNRLTSTEKQLNSQQKNLTDAINASKKIDEIGAQIKLLEKEKAEREETLSKLQKEVDDATKKSTEVKQQLDDFKTRYECAKRSVDDVAVKLRHGLKVGDNCPVCGSKIKVDLLDEAFQNAMKPLEEELAKYEATDKDATTQLNDLRVSLKATEELLKTTQSSLSTSVADLDAQKVTLKSNPTFDDFSIDTPNLTVELSTKLAIVEKTLEENRKKVEQFTKLQGEIVKASQTVSQLTTKLSNSKVQLTEKTSKKEKSQAELDSKNKDLEAAKNDLTSISTQIYEGVPDNLKELSFNKVIEELDKMLSERDKLNKQLTQLTDSIKAAKTLRNDVEKTVSKVEIPDVDVDVPATREDNLQNEVAQLIADVAVNVSRRKENALDLSTLKNQVEQFYTSNQDLSPEFCQALLAMPGDKIDSVGAEIETIQNRAKECYNQYKTALKLAQSQRNSEIERSVDIPLDEATLLAEKLSVDLENQSMALAALQQKLVTDEENKKRFATEREVIEKLEQEFLLWKEVNDDFGGQDGVRFSQVACAFALNNLIEQANFYLAKFAPRYQLWPNTGSLEIAIYDKQSGYKRAFNTFSGGESFVMSLSLALALSSIQEARLVPDTIFIDEGFGTLSADYLDRVMETLEQLQLIEGRRVALISHIDVLRERIPVKITVTPNGSSSNVEVTSN